LSTPCSRIRSSGAEISPSASSFLPVPVSSQRTCPEEIIAPILSTADVAKKCLRAFPITYHLQAEGLLRQLWRICHNGKQRLDSGSQQRQDSSHRRAGHPSAFFRAVFASVRATLTVLGFVLAALLRAGFANIRAE